MVKGQMTAKEFNALRPRLGRVTVETLEIARKVLVDGQSQIDVAKTHGLTRQRVSGMVNRVLATAGEIPPDWKKVDTWLPPELAKQVEDMAAEARSSTRRKG